MTRIPLPGMVDPEDLGAATVWLPFVGACIGGLAAGLFWVANMLWPTVVALILSTGAIVLATGALHEDGLADAADGLGGGTTAERALEIMRDSRIGSYGAIALILTIALKLSALASLSRMDIVAALIAGHTLARCSSVWLLYRYHYVGTKGEAIASGVTTSRVIMATAFTVGVCALALRSRLYIPLATSVVVTTAAGIYFGRRLNGVNGDCLGAANQLVEVAVYLALAASLP